MARRLRLPPSLPSNFDPLISTASGDDEPAHSSEVIGCSSRGSSSENRLRYTPSASPAAQPKGVSWQTSSVWTSGELGEPSLPI
jgi:hypothetical protein